MNVSYSSRRQSGIDWVGEVPKHWTVVKPKYILTKMDRAVEVGDEIITCFRDGVVTLRKNRREDGFTHSIKEIGYQKILEGDLVVHEMDGFEGAIGVSDSTGKSTPVYTVISKSEKYEVFYWMYLLREMSKTGFIESLSRSIRQRTTEFRWKMWKDIYFPSPPVVEQKQIVFFLDSKTQKIDKLIALTEQKIELLKEQRTALINQCVTKGLNPNVEMKDSGVEWIGEIPTKWECGKLNYFATRIGDGLHSTPKYVDTSEYRFINGNNLKNGKIVIFDNTKCVNESQYHEHYIELNKLTLLLSINGTIGNISFYEDEKVILGKSACYIRCSNEINHQFVFYLIQSDSIQRYFIFESSGTTIFNLSLESVRKMPVPYSDLDEQHRIVEYLDDKTQKIDTTIEKESQRIELLKEYRQSLISEVVTGKIDVRGIDYE